MNEAVELHDSTLEGVEIVGSDVVVRLRPAYVHRSDGRPGFDPGSGWTRDVDLLVLEGTLDVIPLELPARRSSGPRPSTPNG